MAVQRKGKIVLEIIQAGGWLMIPLLLCSVVALAIIAERFWGLQRKRVAPDNLLSQVWQTVKAGQLDANRIANLRAGSPLGRVLAAGLLNSRKDRSIMKQAIEEVGRQEIHQLERFLNTLGTIASIAPLIGLLGSVVGLMEVFTTMASHGVGNPQAMGAGISKIMIATAAGLAVAIPALMFYRYFQRKVDDLGMTMEQEAIKLVEVMVGERESAEFSR